MVFEYKEILKRDIALSDISSEDIDGLVEGVCLISSQRSILYLWRPMTRDPDNDFLLELAVEAQVDFTITYNQNDRRIAEQFGI